MYLTQISYNNFRCLEDRKIEFDKNMNIIYGKNGQGKTSLIESIYFLGTGKSFRTKKTKEIFRYNTNRVITFGTFYDRSESKKNIAIDVNVDKKEFYIDKVKNKYVDYIGILNVISFIPEDIEIIIGNPSIRRNFFNYEISQARREYLRNLIDFEKILKIRNKMINTLMVDKSIDFSNVYSLFQCIYTLYNCTEMTVIKNSKLMVIQQQCKLNNRILLHPQHLR